MLLRELAASSLGVEEDTLTTDVLRFDNDRWTTSSAAIGAA